MLGYVETVDFGFNRNSKTIESLQNEQSREYDGGGPRYKHYDVNKRRPEDVSRVRAPVESAAPL